MSAARYRQFFNLQALNMTFFFCLLSYVVEDFARTTKPNMICSEKNCFEFGQGVLDDKWTEQMKFIVHNVRWIFAEVMFYDGALDGTAVAKHRQCLKISFRKA